MILTEQDFQYLRKELRFASQHSIKLRSEGTISKYDCQTVHLNADGRDYRLEPKPKGNKERIEKYGHKTERIGGVLYVHVPNGIHGTDHLGIDPSTGEIVCTLCKGKK